MNACYNVAESFKKILSREAGENLDKALQAAMPQLQPLEARIAIVQSFEDALEEISHIPNLPDDYLQEMLGKVRTFQGRALMACSQLNVKGFNEHGTAHAAIETLTLIGHTVASSHISKEAAFDRDNFLTSTEEMLDAARRSNLPQMQSAVIQLKLKAIIRIMHECEGLSDNQVRRKLKNIYADVRAEFDDIDGEHAEFLEKFRAWVASSMKGGISALGLTADTLTVLSIVGPVAAVALLEAPKEPRLIEGPPAAHQAEAE